jgi:hypothetical protein
MKLNKKIGSFFFISLFLLGTILAALPVKAQTTYTIYYYVGHGSVTAHNLTSGANETFVGSVLGGTPAVRTYLSGTQLSIEATNTETDYAFSHWSFFGSSSSNFTMNPFPVTMLSSFTLISYFNLINNENYVYFTTHNSPSEGGSIVWYDTTNPLPNIYSANNGILPSIVSEGDLLGFSVGANTGYVFDNWTLATTSNTTYTDNPLSVTALYNFTLTAFYHSVPLTNKITLYFDPALPDGSDGSQASIGNTLTLAKQTSYHINMGVQENTTGSPTGTYDILLSPLEYTQDLAPTIWATIPSNQLSYADNGQFFVTGNWYLSAYAIDRTYYQVLRINIHYADGGEYTKDFFVTWLDNTASTTPTPTGSTDYLASLNALLWNDTARLIYGIITLAVLCLALAYMVKLEGLIFGAVIALVINILAFQWGTWVLFPVILGIVYLVVAEFRKGSA